MAFQNFRVTISGLDQGQDLFTSLVTFAPVSDYFVLSFLVLFSKYRAFFDDACRLRVVLLLESVLNQQRGPPKRHAELYQFTGACLRCFRAGASQKPPIAARPPTQEVLDSIPRGEGIETPTVSDLEKMLDEMHRLGAVMRQKSPRFLEGPQLRSRSRGVMV